MRPVVFIYFLYSTCTAWHLLLIVFSLCTGIGTRNLKKNRKKNSVLVLIIFSLVLCPTNPILTKSSVFGLLGMSPNLSLSRLCLFLLELLVLVIGYHYIYCIHKHDYWFMQRCMQNIRSCFWQTLRQIFDNILVCNAI